MPKVDLSIIGKKSEPLVFEYTWNRWVMVSYSHHSCSLVQKIFPDRVKDLNHHCVFEYFG
jgi:hypothetical protein